MRFAGGTHRLQIPTKGATLAFTEQNKRRLHARLCEVIGTEEADILMEQLPPITWTEFATKRDLDELRIATKHDIEFSAIATRTELEQVITKTRTDLEQLIFQTRTDLEKSIMEVKHSVETTKLEITATIERGFRNQSWKMSTAIMSSQLVTVGLLGLMINSLQ